MEASKNGSTAITSLSWGATDKRVSLESPPKPSVTITIAQSSPAEKAENGVTFGDGTDALAASAGMAAALFAYLSLRQVRRLTETANMREARRATLDLLTAMKPSLGHLSKPLEDAVEARAVHIAALLMMAGAHGTHEDITTAVANGRLLDIQTRLDGAVLELLADWYGPMSRDEKDAFATYWNKLEETCTSIQRATLDVRTLDKMYGTLICETYREASQAIYAHRRALSYRYYDQLEHVIDRLLEARFQLFRAPGWTLRLRWIFSSAKRALGQALRQHDGQHHIDAGQIEAAIAANRQLNEEEKLRPQLMVKGNAVRFAVARSGPFGLGGKKKPLEFEVRAGASGPLAIVRELALSAATAIDLADNTIDVEHILLALPARLFHPEHLNSRDISGTFSGPQTIHICALCDPATIAAEQLRLVLRVLKRELNTGRQRPFVLTATASAADLGRLQPVVYSEGGMLLHLDLSQQAAGAAWLF